MKTRNEIEEKYKWDLDLFKTDEEIEKVFKYIDKLIKVVPEYNGQLGNKEKLYEFWFKFKKERREISKLSFYIFNKISEDNSNTKILKLQQRFDNACTKLSQAEAFVNPQLYELTDEYLLSLLSDKRFKNFENVIKDIIKFKPHKLDQHSSVLISKISKALNQNSSVFDIISDSELEYADALDSKGKAHKVDNASYGELVISTDRTLRKNAFFSLMNGYGKFNKTIAALLVGDMQADFDFAKLKNYSSTLEQALLVNDVPQSVFDKNLEEVNKNLPILHKFLKIVAKKEGLKDYAYYDLFQDKKVSGKMTVEKAQEILLKAVEPLGEEYLENVNRKLADKSIDYMPNKNKATGGYSCDCYGAKTIILMNWAYDYSSLSTLCHEMGHCINSELYLKTQPEEKAEIIIPLAEIASTVNEILLVNYMLKNCKPKEKEYYLYHFLNEARATIFQQSMYSEFELYAHTCVEKEIPVTYEDLNNKYLEVAKKYYKTCVVPDCLKFGWSRIPHFYRPYYVYSYSTGMITAIAIVSKILSDKNYYKKYIQFLKNGINKSFMEILKSIDIDLTTDEPYEIAFNFINEKLKEYEQI